ncbi:MFS transporter [Marinicrinis lubricantis]|uniref:MFS transporter n=1 Tax=Marinicrinis lubricantis TaxID=2086470 RepID=A0ABW1IRM2_9BACL
MQSRTQEAAAFPNANAAGKPVMEVRPTAFRILLAISLVHLCNDTIQAIFPAILPILKENMNLSYLQAGIIIFTLNMTSSVLQPVVGFYSDRRPSPYMLPIGMVLTTVGVLIIALSGSYVLVLMAVLLVGLGSAVFHPEASRVAYMAAGSRRGLAQSIFQVGGNAGSSLAPIMTALIFYPFGQFGAIWFTLITGLAIVVQLYIARWYGAYLATQAPQKKKVEAKKMDPAKKRRITSAICLLIFLIFVRTWYHSAISIYYPFQLMDKFDFSLKHTQIYIFIYAAAGVLGTFLGGPISDQIGRKNVLFLSIFGAAPLALLLPYADSLWAYPILFINGLILLSGWSVAVVYAQELIPGMIGTVSGLITGLAFGIGALGAVAIGGLIDLTSLNIVMTSASFLPIIGLLAWFLPSDREIKQWSTEDTGA